MSKKPPMQVHVTSSDMKSLLQAQRDSLASLRSIEEIMKTVKLLEMGSLIEAKKLDDENEEEVKLDKESLKVAKESLKVQKDISKSSKESLKFLSDEARAIAKMAESIKTGKTLSERASGGFKKLGENLSPSGMWQNLLKKTNILGINQKAIDRNNWIKAQKTIDPNAKTSDLKKNFEHVWSATKESQANEKKIADYKKMTGMSEEKMKNFKSGRDLLDQRQVSSDKIAKYDLRAQALRGDEESKTPSQKHADAGRDEESQIEIQKNVDTQTKLLEKIEVNTRGDSPEQKAKPAEAGEKGGLLSGLMGGGGIGKALKGMKDFGVGLIAMAGALWVAGKALQEFADVEWESVGKGLLVLGGLVLAGKAMAKVQGDLIKGALGLGLLAAAVWGMGKALESWKGIEDVIVPATAAIGGLAIVASLMGKNVVSIGLGALAIAGLGAAVWVLGKGMQEMGDAFNLFIDGVERLSNIGFEGLAGVAGGMTLLGAAMVAFGTGNAIAGVSNLVTGFLSAVTGQKTPVEQLIDIGNAGEGINKAGSGMQRLAEGMKAFGEIKGDQLKSLKQFPWEEATKFVAAGGVMSVNGASVYNQSKANADEQAANESKSSGGNTTVVNAPTTVSKHSHQLPTPIRNQESSRHAYQQSRIAIMGNF